jgi:hypothetical protein
LKSSYIKSFIEHSVSKFKLEVHVRADYSSFVFCSVYVVSLYWFIQVIDFEIFGKFWSMNIPPVPLSMRVLTVYLLKQILMETEIEFCEIFAIATE